MIRAFFLFLILNVSISSAEAALRPDGVCAASLRTLSRIVGPHKFSTTWLALSTAAVLTIPFWLPKTEEVIAAHKSRRAVLERREFVLSVIKNAVTIVQNKAALQGTEPAVRERLEAEAIILKAIERHNLMGLVNADTVLTSEEAAALKKVNSARVMYNALLLAMQSPGQFNFEIPKAIFASASPEQWADLLLEVTEKLFIVKGIPVEGKDGIIFIPRAPFAASEAETLKDSLELDALSLLFLNAATRKEPHPAQLITSLDSVPTEKALNAHIALRILLNGSQRLKEHFSLNRDLAQRFQVQAERFEILVQATANRSRSIRNFAWSRDEVTKFLADVEVFEAIRQTANKMEVRHDAPPSAAASQPAAAAYE